MSTRFAVPFLVLGLLGASQRSLACSCCADPGDWFRGNRTLFTSEKVAMESAMYSGTLLVEMTDPGIDREFENMAITGAFHDGQFSLWANGERELLRLSVPDSYESLLTDTGEHGTTVVLYKEHTFDCAVKIVDARLSRFAGTHATLILQGHGNHCFTLDDLQRWIVRFDDGSENKYQSHDCAYGSIDTGHVPANWHDKR